MTCVFVAPVGAFQEVKLTGELLEYIEKTKSEPLRCQRRTAYALLFNSLGDLGLGSVKLLREPSGKPYIVDSDGVRPYEISLSHTDGLVAVCISDTHEVGIDIEGEIFGERARRIEERFLLGISPVDKELSLDKISLYGNVSQVPEPPAEVLKKWTFVEAIGKCHGAGFRAIRDIETIGKEMEISSVSLEYSGKKYFLVLAARDKK